MKDGGQMAQHFSSSGKYPTLGPWRQSMWKRSVCAALLVLHAAAAFWGSWQTVVATGVGVFGFIGCGGGASSHNGCFAIRPVLHGHDQCQPLCVHRGLRNKSSQHSLGLFAECTVFLWRRYGNTAVELLILGWGHTTINQTNATVYPG